MWLGRQLFVCRANVRSSQISANHRTSKWRSLRRKHKSLISTRARRADVCLKMNRYESPPRGKSGAWEIPCKQIHSIARRFTNTEEPARWRFAVARVCSSTWAGFHFQGKKKGPHVAPRFNTKGESKGIFGAVGTGKMWGGWFIVGAWLKSLLGSLGNN